MQEMKFSPLDVKFRGKTSSSEFNQSEIDKHSDIISLYRKSNDLLEKMTETGEVAIVENHFLKDKLDRIEQAYNLLLLQMNALNIKKDTGELEKIQEVYARDFTVTDEAGAALHEERAFVRPLLGQFVTCNHSNYTIKTHLIKNDSEIVMPKDLKVELYKSNPKMSLSHNGFDRMFNGDFASIWQAKLVDKDNVGGANEQALQMVIHLPTSISQQKKVNTIIMYPHPIQGMLIDNIEIYFNGTWTQIPGFHQNGTISHEGIHQWSFEDMYAEQIRITLRQREILTIGEESVYYFGMQHLEIAHRTYSQTPTYSLTRFDMSEEGLYEITGIKHTFLNREAFSVGTYLDDELIGSVYDYKFYKKEYGDDLIEIPESQLSGNLSAPEIWVKTILRNDVYNGVPPFLQKIQLRYVSK